MKLLYQRLLIVSMLVFFEVSYCQKTTYHDAFQVINLTEKDSGKIMAISKTQTFTLTLSNKVDGGYRFDAAKYDAAVLRLEKHREGSPAAHSGLGSHGQDFWRFTALKKGKTALKITATRPWVGGGTIIIFSGIITVN